MIVFEFIGQVFAYIFVEILFKGIVPGIYNLISKGLNYARYKLTGRKPKKRKQSW
jgi:hypothetical protein